MLKKGERYIWKNKLEIQITGLWMLGFECHEVEIMNLNTLKKKILLKNKIVELINSKELIKK